MRHDPRPLRIALLTLAALASLTMVARATAQGTVQHVEAVSLFGEPLYRPEPPAALRARLERELAEALLAYNHTPHDADSIISLGRRLAYLGRFTEAIAKFSEGIGKHPSDPRMYRHRGHRFITIRRFDDARRDLEYAAQLVRGRVDEIEPDGQPNARNIPTSTLQSNIWYHLGLAYYLEGRFQEALDAYRENLRVARNPDILVAVSHWLYMTLRRLGREAEAAAVLQPITADMDVIENGSYHRLLLMYQGRFSPESLLKTVAVKGSVEDVTVSYGVASWYLYNGRRAEAEALLRKILGQRAQWAAFGYIASEADARRLGIVPDGAQRQPVRSPFQRRGQTSPEILGERIQQWFEIGSPLERGYEHQTRYRHSQ
jgi:tetratricopeptide (TPR) repeat protein